ncbi:translocon-associated subunit beta [Olea europaea subsp. europaea]|uniref:Translocon-associated subunit beta n=1 Tax=Olea europaea subsp. europaea TaxID=158383 RepID=A0A8S0SVX4_OLEEU|nr:translocon-associated subunit beta [Olea europaea subsp. europaea]
MKNAPNFQGDFGNQGSSTNLSAIGNDLKYRFQYQQHASSSSSSVFLRAAGRTGGLQQALELKQQGRLWQVAGDVPPTKLLPTLQVLPLIHLYQNHLLHLLVPTVFLECVPYFRSSHYFVQTINISRLCMAFIAAAPILKASTVFVVLALIFISSPFANASKSPFIVAHKRVARKKINSDIELISVSIDVYNRGSATAYDVILAEDSWAQDVFDS